MADEKVEENKTERVQLLMTPSEVKAIDDWSFENRIRGRAEAMRRLCQIGIEFDRQAMPISRDFVGVSQAILNCSSELIEIFRRLPDEKLVPVIEDVNKSLQLIVNIGNKQALLSKAAKIVTLSVDFIEFEQAIKIIENVMRQYDSERSKDDGR